MTASNQIFTDTVNVTTTDVVLDTCVLMDLLFAERADHAAATELATALRTAGTKALVPVHAAFELVSAVASEKRRRGAPVTLVGKRSDLFPFDIVLVVLDLNFLNECLVAPLNDGKLIDVSGGDMIFAAIALRYSLVLVSGDEKLRRRAQQSGITALGVPEYLQRQAKK